MVTILAVGCPLILPIVPNVTISTFVHYLLLYASNVDQPITGQFQFTVKIGLFSRVATIY